MLYNPQYTKLVACYTFDTLTLLQVPRPATWIHLTSTSPPTPTSPRATTSLGPTCPCPSMEAPATPTRPTPPLTWPITALEGDDSASRALPTVHRYAEAALWLYDRLYSSVQSRLVCNVRLQYARLQYARLANARLQYASVLDCSMLVCQIVVCQIVVCQVLVCQIIIYMLVATFTLLVTSQSEFASSLVARSST